MPTANKVQFGLKNVHFFPLTGADTYGAAVAIPGGVNINLAARGESTEFYADNIVYYASVANNGYEGDLELAKITDGALTAIFGHTLGATSKVLTEHADVEPTKGALAFQIDGDADEECYILYVCNFGRPAITSGTITNTKEPVTATVSITVAPRADGKVMARTTADTPSATKSSWFTTPFVEA